VEAGDLAALVTAAVAVAGVVITVWAQLVQQAGERRRQLDERFTGIIAELGSKSAAVQAGAAVSIISYLAPEYRRLHDQVFLVLLANLKLNHGEALNRLLVAAFERAMRVCVPEIRKRTPDFELDLSHSNLYRAELAGLDLSGADLGHAKLRAADLSGSNLRRAQGWEVDLSKARISRAELPEARLRKANLNGCQAHEANLMSARLEETDSSEAEFYRARLQSAHFEDADLRGARFEQADLNDTYFNGARLDERALKSIAKARNWRKAHFDEAVAAQLETLAADTVEQ
jgi:hypothetical protein